MFLFHREKIILVLDSIVQKEYKVTTVFFISGSNIQKRFYTNETIRGIIISYLADFFFFMIGCDDWIRKWLFLWVGEGGLDRHLLY